MPEITSGAGVLFLTALLGYLLGSIPFGVVITGAMGLGDLRKIGSGNIGATNVLRTGNKAAALATLLLDGGKGAAAVLIARALAGEDAAQLAGLAAFLGHLFPIWLNFRGGKGVATYIGVLIGLKFSIALIFAAIWLSIAYLSRYSSLSALVASLLTPLLLWFWVGDPRAATLMGLLTVLLWIMHRTNIARLLDGSEGKIGQKG
jgi:glycerol-3-phosphate acyltransferase PlsY